MSNGELREVYERINRLERQVDVINTVNVEREADIKDILEALKEMAHTMREFDRWRERSIGAAGIIVTIILVYGAVLLAWGLGLIR